jgi:hypothetical protein
MTYHICPYGIELNIAIADDAMNEIRSTTNGNYVLGSVRFQQEIEKMLGRRVVKGNAGRPVLRKGCGGSGGWNR